MSEVPPILILVRALKSGLLDTLIRYTADNGRLATSREISIALMSIASTTAKKDPKFSFAKGLAMLMVEACKYDRELAHAAIDDAFDVEARARKKDEPPKKPAA